MRETTLQLVQRTVSAMVQAAQSVRDDTRAVEATKDHVEIIKHYNHLRIAMEEIKVARKALEELNEQLSREIVPDAMRAAGVKTITLEGVGRITISHRYSCSMPDKEQGIKWLKDNGHGGIVQETVNAQTLASFAKSMLEEQGEELPEDIFKTGTSPFTSITKVK